MQRRAWPRARRPGCSASGNGSGHACPPLSRAGPCNPKVNWRSIRFRLVAGHRVRTPTWGLSTCGEPGGTQDNHPTPIVIPPLSFTHRATGLQPLCLERSGKTIPERRSFRFRLALRTRAPWGARVVSLTKSRKMPTRKALPLVLLAGEDGTRAQACVPARRLPVTALEGSRSKHPRVAVNSSSFPQPHARPMERTCRQAGGNQEAASTRV